MPSLKKMLEERKEAKKQIGVRTPVARVLLTLGFFLVFAVLGIFSLTPAFSLQPSIFLPIAAVFLGLLIVFGVHYKVRQTKEQVEKRIKPKTFVETLIFTIVLLVFIFIGLSFFLRLAINNPYGWADKERGLLAFSQVSALVMYFGSLPFIMAFWYRTAAPMGVQFIVKLHQLFNRKGKNRIAEIVVLEQPQRHSFYVTIKRAFNALIFSAFTTFTGVVPILQAMERSGIPPLFGLGLIPPDAVVAAGVDSVEFVRYCGGYILNLALPVVVSFVIFFWAMPSTYLLDDAGVVFYRKYKNRRQPAEIRTVSAWFLSLVKAVLGTSALLQYVYFVLDNLPVIELVAAEMNSMAAVEFAIYIFGFPFFGTLLMGFILAIFLESQFNKLKTFLYQELIKIKIDPRIVSINLERNDKFQENTLMKYWGEGFLHNKPLCDSVGDLGKVGPIDIDEEH